MKVPNLLKLSLVSLLVCPLSSTASLPAGAQAAPIPLYIDPLTGYKYALDDPNHLPDALQPPKQPKKKGPLRELASGIGKELGTSFEDMGKDMVLIFSVQDIDPYEKPVNPNKPYEQLQVRYIDGTGSSVIRYPDKSAKMQGGFADGTVIVPQSPLQFEVFYPNGLKGRLEKTGGGAKIYRPDNSVTTISRNSSGSLSISNDKMGYMGLATPDQTGLRYEMSTGSY